MISDYKEAIDFVYGQLPIFSKQGPPALKYNLDNINALCKRLGNPHLNFKSIHVGGTNGKGTTSHIIASILQEAGFKVGLHTSPHYKEFRERAKINGLLVPEAYVTDFIKDNYETFLEMKPSYFELSVALAFKYFSDSGVDIAIIEVGLGGRLDSTNILNPLLSVITNISYDHTQVLGDTLAKIAKEKAGIIKPNIPVVIGEKDDNYKVIFIEKAQKMNSVLTFADDVIGLKIIENKVDSMTLSVYKPFAIERLNIGTSGPFIFQNIKYALAAINIFSRFYNQQFNISIEHIKNGIINFKNNTTYIGRWSVISGSPLVIADGAHNFDAISRLFEYIKDFNFNRLFIIMGVVGDKSWEQTMNILPKNAHYLFTQAAIPRALSSEALLELGGKHGLKGEKYPDVNIALSDAKSKAATNDLILIIGSIYLLEDIENI